MIESKIQYKNLVRLLLAVLEVYISLIFRGILKAINLDFIDDISSYSSLTTAEESDNRYVSYLQTFNH